MLIVVITLLTRQQSTTKTADVSNSSDSDNIIIDLIASDDECTGQYPPSTVCVGDPSDVVEMRCINQKTYADNANIFFHNTNNDPLGFNSIPISDGKKEPSSFEQESYARQANTCK